MPKGSIASIIIGAILLVGIFLAILSSEGLQHCISNNGQYPTSSNITNHAPAIAVSHTGFSLYWNCLGYFANENGIAITALSTILLTFLTGGLVFVGYQQSRTTQRELRAYLSVVVGRAVYQETAKSIRFEGVPVILNNGKTPAYKVRYTAQGDIIPHNLVANYTFTVPPNAEISQASIGPGENRILSIPIQHYVNDSDIEDIKDGKNNALWVWGTVHYEDVFGHPRYVNFCQKLTWFPNGEILGLYSPRFSDSN